MKAQMLLLISITLSLVFSLVATLASYFYYTEPLVLDARFLYRGWPLHWLTESWSKWSPPPPPSYHISFQLAGFLGDLLFYAVFFQAPTQLYLYFREARRPQIQT